jgi:hypothetical protein
MAEVSIRARRRVVARNLLIIAMLKVYGKTGLEIESTTQRTGRNAGSLPAGSGSD